MKKKSQDSWEYKLTITYDNDQQIDQQIHDLLAEMSFQADLDCCFIEANVTELGTERRW